MKNKKLYEKFHSQVIKQEKLIDRHNFTYKIVLSVLSKYLNKKQKILDIGCGVGTLSFYMAEKSKSVLGIDISQNAIEVAKESSKNLKLKNVSFQVSNFPNDTIIGNYDLILCSEVLEHLEEDSLALQQMYTLLKPKGVIIISVPSKNAPIYKLGLANKFDQRVGHLRRYNLEELTEKCKNVGFKLLETKRTEGTLRNFLFLNPVAGKSIRFIKYFLVDLVTWLDILTLNLFGESQLFVILTKQ